LVKGLDGRVNVIYRKTVENALSVKDLADIGVARISMGPGLWRLSRESMNAFDEELKRILTT
jgi:2-methylisocitrate lyase-like PEP mutase family enzyme